MRCQKANAISRVFLMLDAKKRIDLAGMCGNFGRLRGWQQLARVVSLISSFAVHVCQDLNSHYFHMIGDGHQPKWFPIKCGMTIPKIGSLDHGACDWRQCDGFRCSSASHSGGLGTLADEEQDRSIALKSADGDGPYLLMEQLGNRNFIVPSL